ncbi:TetR/AcrR family transcriptional regulator [Bosea sp. BK604]|uniref:TetR/AcrR family transcriptional regulator n=1 Tax=Bosea sp. BK604 TaxID=2512180 RepID=UPI0010528A20|nr:TetR/AcrR family transcriptional regulator [Bosea sp. BK604]TCR68493.1 TetR family transcriptional regulator [Bosea sp. BK604]
MAASPHPKKDLPQLAPRPVPGRRVRAGRVERNAEQSKSRILEAALEIFAAGGFGGARVDEIALKAGVSKNLIYHYFGNKESLYVAVLEKSLNALAEYHDSLPVHFDDPEEAMRQIIRNTFDYFVATPKIISLMNTENLLRAKYIKSSDLIRSIYKPIMERFHRIIEFGSQKSVFRSDIDEVDLYISISALSYFYLSNQWTLSHIFKRNLGDAPFLAQRKEHIVAMVMSYLKP